MHKLFAGQLEGEKIYLVVRRHWYFLVKRIVITALIAGIYIFFMTTGPETMPGLFDGTAGTIVLVFSRLFQLGLLFALLIIWALYYLNMQIVTNIRIVDVDQISLFSRTVSELNIVNVQDVTSESKGIFATIFGFGDVYVQTAGVQQRFIFEAVPHPEEIKKLLLDLYEKEANRPRPVTHEPSSQPQPEPQKIV